MLMCVRGVRSPRGANSANRCEQVRTDTDLSQWSLSTKCGTASLYRNAADAAPMPQYTEGRGKPNPYIGRCTGRGNPLRLPDVVNDPAVEIPFCTWISIPLFALFVMGIGANIANTMNR